MLDRLASLLALASLLLASSVKAQECVPQCRSGYVCVKGACISACNPPCETGQRCVSGECVAEAPPAVSTAPVPPSVPAATPYVAPPPPPPPPAAAAPQAAPLASTPPPEVIKPPPDADGAPKVGSQPLTHDGFYLQLGLGIGYAIGSVETDVYDVDVSGIGQLGQIALGGTVAPGVVVGGAVYGTNVFTTTYKVGPKDAENFNKIEEEGDLSSASLVAPFVTFYPDPRNGLFVTGGAGLTVIAAGKGESLVPETSGTGFGMVLAAGYEAFVGKEWSLGGAARLLYLSASLDDDDGHTGDFTGWVPGLVAVATYH